MSNKIDTTAADNAAYLAQIAALVNTTKPRGAWAKGVKTYALELLETNPEGFLYHVKNSYIMLEGLLLRTRAISWEAYSLRGHSLILDSNIAKRLCSTSELKRYKNGLISPNGIDWDLIQAKALREAFDLIISNACKLGAI